MLTPFSKQFEEPEGILGTAAGLIMSVENRTINKWTLDLLAVKEGDTILEVGYGPGYAIEIADKNVNKLLIDGVDISDTMMSTARKRNEELVEEAKLRLFTADISEFQADRQYDKVYTVNNYPLWSNKEKGLANIYRMLKPAGKIAVTVQPREEDADESKTKDLGRSIISDLEKAGFSAMAVHYKEVRPVLTVCVTAFK